MNQIRVSFRHLFHFFKEQLTLKITYSVSYKSIISFPNRLLLCREVRPPTTNQCPVYDNKQSDGEAPVMLEVEGMRSTPSLPSLPCPLWPGVVAPDRVLYMCQIEPKYELVLN